jgi:hypothetical protein
MFIAIFEENPFEEFQNSKGKGSLNFEVFAREDLRREIPIESFVHKPITETHPYHEERMSPSYHNYGIDKWVEKEQSDNNSLTDNRLSLISSEAKQKALEIIAGTSIQTK